jgi:hypothetical protein
LFAVLCLGIAVALVLDFCEPLHTSGAVYYWHHQWERPYHLLGLLSGLGMLTWCLIFKKTERGMMIAGWLLVALAFYVASDVPLVN